MTPTPPPGPLLGCIFVFYNTAVAALSIVEWNEQIRRRNGKGLEEASDGSPLKKEHKIVQIPIDLLSLCEIKIPL